MATYSWNVSDGDWGTAGNWTPSGGPPNSASAKAIIARSGGYTVTLSNEQIVANTVTLDASLALLEISASGTLDLGGASPTFLLDAGVLDLAGTIAGGAVKLAGGTAILVYGAELSGVTWQGPLTLDYNTVLDIANGLTVQTASGGDQGYIDLTAGYDALYSLNSETLNNVTLGFGSNGNDTLYNDDQFQAGDTLTLGTGFTLAVADTQYDEIDTITNAYSHDSIINDGTFELTGGVLAVQNGTFANAGTVFIDRATFELANTDFTNPGGITIEAGGTLELASYVTLTELDSTGAVVNNGGTLLIGSANGFYAGTLDLGGGTMDVAPTGLFSDVVVSDGTLANGMVQLDGGSLAFGSGDDLSGITWRGTLALAYDTALSIANGLTVQTASGGSPGYIDLTAGSDSLTVLDSETWDRETLDFGSLGADSLYNYDQYQAGDTLTLGTGFTLAVSGGGPYDLNGSSLANLYNNDSITNDGTFVVTGGNLVVQNGTFTNAGQVFVDNAEVDFSTTTLMDTGSIDVGAGGIALLGSSFDITGRITIEAGGALGLAGGVTLAELESAGPQINNGGTLLIAMLDLGGGTMDVTPTGLISDVLLGGTLSNGTVIMDGGIVDFYPIQEPGYGAGLSGITLQGTLALPYDNALYISNGFTGGSVSGDGRGYIDLTAGADTLYIVNSETLDDVTVDFGGVGFDGLWNFFQYQAGVTLTLGTGFTLVASGSQPWDDALGNEYNNNSIINNGTIDITGGELFVSGGSFTNAGTVFVDDATLELFDTDFTNTGSITMEAGALLVMGGYVTFAGQDRTGSVVNNGGALEIDGTLDLSGGTMDVAPCGLFTDVVVYGTLADGTVRLDGGSMPVLSTAALSGITWQGALALSNGTTLSVLNGLTVQTESGGSPGYIDLTAGDDALYVMDSETLDYETLDFGSAGDNTLRT